MNVFDYLLKIRSEKGAGFLVLLDPDEASNIDLVDSAKNAESGGADALLIGGSLMLKSTMEQVAEKIKNEISIPLIIFPNGAGQLNPHADAVLFTSLLSGRNPEYLISQQVKGAPLVKEFNLETIPTAYLLIESGGVTSVQYLSHTQPIPANKPDIVKAHALAAQYLGMKVVYLEAGSGAKNSVPDDVIRSVANYIDLPILCGGGIRSPKTAAEKVKAGADFIVIGNRFQEDNAETLYQEFSVAIHSSKAVRSK